MKTMQEEIGLEDEEGEDGRTERQDMRGEGMKVWVRE